MSINFFSSESGENMDVTVIFKAYYKNQILKAESKFRDHLLLPSFYRGDRNFCDLKEFFFVFFLLQ